MSNFLKVISFLFISIAFLACEKDEGTDIIPSDVLYFFRGEVDGEEIKIDVTLTNSNANYITNGGSLDYPNCQFSYGGSVGDQLENPPFFGFELVDYFDGLCEDEPSQFPALFEIGEIVFDDMDYQNVKNSVDVFFYNGDVTYTSKYGDQTGSNFTITKITEADNIYGLHQDVEATFNCKLYNEQDQSDFIEIENGTARLSLGSYYN